MFLYRINWMRGKPRSGAKWHYQFFMQAFWLCICWRQVWQLVLQVCAGLICIKDQNDGYFSGRLKKGIGEYAGWESEQFDSRIVNML